MTRWDKIRTVLMAILLAIFVYIIISSSGCKIERTPQDDPLIVFTANGDSVVVYHFNARERGSTGSLEGIWHATIGDSLSLWGLVPQGKYVLELHNMTGAPPIVLPVTIEVYQSRGRP